MTLPAEVAEMLREKVASGAYASKSEVVHDCLRELRQRDIAAQTEMAAETWLRSDVVAAYDEYHADPSTGVPGDEILERIQARYRRLVETRSKTAKLHDAKADLFGPLGPRRDAA